jgi:hypothetical protein
LGGKFVFDTTCPPITRTSSLGCITDCSNEDLCTGQLHGIVAPTVAGCPSEFECFYESEFFLKCLEDLCPHSSDEVEYLDVDNVSGDASFRNLNDGRTYDCTVVFDRSDDGFDCAADPRVGDIAVIGTANSRGGVICTGGLAIGLDVVPGFSTECTYACDGL